MYEYLQKLFVTRRNADTPRSYLDECCERLYRPSDYQYAESAVRR